MGLANPNMCACALCYTRLSRGARTEVRLARRGASVHFPGISGGVMGGATPNARAALAVCVSLSLSRVSSLDPHGGRGSAVGGIGRRVARSRQRSARARAESEARPVRMTA